MILGVASDSEYIVRMNHVELDMLSEAHIGGWKANQARIGKSYDVARTWHMLRMLKEERESLQRTANKLRALADILGPIECEIPTVEKVTNEATSK